MAAIDDLNGLLSSLPGYDLLTDPMKQAALDQSLIPDGAGVWPTKPGYQTTYDIYWAATKLISFLQAQPVVRQTSSEGTSIAVDAPNWTGLIAYFNSMSRIAQATQGDLIVEVAIPGMERFVKRTDMSGRWDGYGDVDTDAS